MPTGQLFTSVADPHHFARSELSNVVGRFILKSNKVGQGNML